jgi:hypothetical protein
LALIGKYRNLPLIKHLNDKPVKEINICGEGFLIIPHIYERAKYNDEDIYYECNKLYKYSELGNRQHPIHLNSLQIDRSEIHNDPAAWILGAKRLTAVCSQIVLKAMLWNRTPVMKKNTLPFSFMCSKDYKAEEKTPIDFVNYYLFGYLIPADLMFDKSYWKWRMTKPTESEIYIRHLNYICNILSVDFDRLTSESIDSQFDMIMCSRKCDAQLLEYLNKKTEKKLIDYRVALCRFNVGGLNYWRINELTDGGYISVLKLDSFNGEKVEFYPLDDIAGFVALKTVEVNGTIVYDEEKSSFIYCKKNEGHFDIQQIPLGGKIQIKCIWKYQTIQENITAK